MDKKDIYEHLAKIYLDNTPSVAAKKAEIPVKKSRNFYLIAAIPFAVGLLMFLLLVSFKGRGMPLSTTSLVVSADTIKMSFNLDSAQKQVYDLDLKHINLNNYKSLVFSLRDSNYNDKLSFRVEIGNAFKEHAELYVRDVGSKWKECRLSLADFKGVSDWSEVTRLSFVVEEWNSRDDKGILYIDNVRFLK